jgi:putative sterol carrier protein
LEKNRSSEVAEVFRLLPARFQAGRTSKTLVYYFSIDDEKWTVTVSPDRCEVKRGKKEGDADCFLKTSTEIFLSTISGEYVPSFMDVVTGRLKTNSPILLNTFKSVFS